jgi:hypothetical protein
MYIGVSIVTIGVLAFLLIHCNNNNKNTDGYCICSGARKEVCQQDMKKAYNNGMTEYSKLKGPDWNTPQPGHYDYPVRQGCHSKL